MFCYQCEQTARGTGCTKVGVCGKDHTTAVLQDLLLYAAQGISMYAHRARALGASDRAIDIFVLEALFTTVTNVNFDPARLQGLIAKAAAIRDKAKDLYEKACKKAGAVPEKLGGPAALVFETTLEGMLKQGEAISIPSRREKLGDDAAGLQELLMYGLKGAAAYADHAQILGKESAEIMAAFEDHLD